MSTQIALVPYKVPIDARLLTRVAAALHRQVRQHFGPAWGIDASVSAFLEWQEVPPDYTRLILVDQLDSGALGVHADRNGQPYALVAARGDWSLVASHECLELLADPTGNQLRRGPSPIEAQGEVEFLVEVCDPCQGRRWHYVIDGVPVSDFCLPAYYEGTGAAGERWSFHGSLDGPRRVLRDGYLLWRELVGRTWWRRDWIGAKLADYSLGPISPRVSFLRGHTDRLWRLQHQRNRRTRQLAIRHNAAATARARALAGDIERTLGQVTAKASASSAAKASASGAAKASAPSAAKASASGAARPRAQDKTKSPPAAPPATSANRRKRAASRGRKGPARKTKGT